MDHYSDELAPRKVYEPPLSWIEWENKTEGQIPLFQADLVPTIAERCFVLITNDWLKQESDKELRQLKSEENEKLRLAALYLASEYGSDFSEIAKDQCQKCLNMAYRNIWYISLSWTIALDFIYQKPSFDALISNLDHHKSDVRYYMIEDAWIIRKHLHRMELQEKLLNNIANNIVTVLESAGLLESFFENSETLHEMIDKYTPPSGFENQFKARIEHFRMHGWHSAELHILEREVLHSIEERIFRMRLVNK